MNTKLAKETTAPAAPAPAAPPAAAPTATPLSSGGLSQYLPKITLPKIDWSYYARDGAYAKAMDAQAQRIVGEQTAKTNKQNEDMLKSVLLYSLAGLGAGLSGTKLYNLAKSMNKPKDKYTKFGPGAKTVDDEEKLAADENSTLVKIIDAVKAVPGQIAKKLPEAPQLSGLSPDQQAMFVPAMLFGTGAGLYGGYSIMNGIQERKRKEDIKMMVEEAKKDYQRALTGKRAAALDAAFGTYAEKAAAGNDMPGWLAWAANKVFDPLRASGVWPIYTTAVLGTGGLAGKMTYDWTRERSRDKALERARKSRARLSDVSPLYVDPDQIVAISELAKKQKNAQNQQ